MSSDAAILREMWNPGVTARETCRCGAVFETTTQLQSMRAGELREFREAHEACRVAASQSGSNDE